MVATNDTLEAAAGPSSLLGGAADLKLEPMEIDAVMPDKADLDCPTACCCNMIGIFSKMPECLGCVAKGEFLCCLEVVGCKCCQCRKETQVCYRGQSQGICCDNSTDECICCSLTSQAIAYCCMTDAMKCEIKFPETFCKEACQCFCCDVRCAIPCDDEVPFAIALCGFFCVGGPESG